MAKFEYIKLARTTKNVLQQKHNIPEIHRKKYVFLLAQILLWNNLFSKVITKTSDLHKNILIISTNWNFLIREKLIVFTKASKHESQLNPDNFAENVEGSRISRPIVSKCRARKQKT